MRANWLDYCCSTPGSWEQRWTNQYRTMGRANTINSIHRGGTCKHDAVILYQSCSLFLEYFQDNNVHERLIMFLINSREKSGVRSRVEENIVSRLSPARRCDGNTVANTLCVRGADDDRAMISAHDEAASRASVDTHKTPPLCHRCKHRNGHFFTYTRTT